MELDILNHFFHHLVRAKRIRVNDQIGMVVCVYQPLELLLVLLYCPIQFATFQGDGVRHFQVDEHIWISQALPHVFNVGVFLGDMFGLDAALAQSGDQCGFAGSAGSYDPNF